MNFTPTLCFLLTCFSSSQGLPGQSDMQYALAAVRDVSARESSIRWNDHATSRQFRQLDERIAAYSAHITTRGFIYVMTHETSDTERFSAMQAFAPPLAKRLGSKYFLDVSEHDRSFLVRLSALWVVQVALKKGAFSSDRLYIANRAKRLLHLSLNFDNAVIDLLQYAPRGFDAQDLGAALRPSKYTSIATAKVLINDGTPRAIQAMRDSIAVLRQQAATLEQMLYDRNSKGFKTPGAK